jgi:hypothetical protein
MPSRSSAPGFVHQSLELLHSAYLSFLERRTERKIHKLESALKKLDNTPVPKPADKMAWRARFTSPMTSNPHSFPNGPIWQRVKEEARAKGHHDINLGADPKARRNMFLIMSTLAVGYSAFCTKLYALPYDSSWRPGKTEAFRSILLRQLEGTPTAMAQREGRVNDLRWLPRGERSSSMSGSSGGPRSSSIKDQIIKDAAENRMPVVK